ncbi:MAG: hypothetical protein ACTHNS_06750, partial [Marmoricola sp.]
MTGRLSDHRATTRRNSTSHEGHVNAPHGATRPGGSALLGLPEDLGDLVDLGQELVGDVGVQ